MSFEDPPQRPRSTPIPDSWGMPTAPSVLGRTGPGQHSGLSGQQAGGPTPGGWSTATWPSAEGDPTEAMDRGNGSRRGPATQFAAPDSMPPTNGQIQLYGAAIPVKALTRMWILRSVIAAIVAVAGLGFGLYVYRDSQKKVDEILTTVPTFTFPEVVVPTFTVPKIGVAPISVPNLTVPDITIPDISIPSVAIPPVTAPGAPVPEATATAPAPPPAGLDPSASLYDPAALPQLVDLFEQLIPGEPTQFTQIVLYPTYAIASAQDPADPASTVGVLWRAGATTPMPGFPVQDIETHRFTAADVNWPAVAGLVAQAPQLMNVPTGTVSHVIVLRSDFDPTLPIRVLVYVDEAGGYVEADANGAVVATH